MGATASPEICDIAVYNQINSILKTPHGIKNK